MTLANKVRRAVLAVETAAVTGVGGEEAERTLEAPLMALQRLADEPRATLNLKLSAEELDWVEHAARLRHIPTEEYVRRAINLSLRKEGVDAVLLEESDE